MAYSVTLEAYKGPLDILLELIDGNKLEINEVSLAEVTGQYLDFVEENDLPAKELSDFLSVAVRLLHLKTKALLPYLYEDTEEDETSLEHQLKIYKVYWEASQKINELYVGKTRLFAKTKSTLFDEPVFSPPSKTQVTTSVIKTVFFNLINGLEIIKELPRTSIKKTVSLAQKIAMLKQMFQSISSMKFKKFIYGADNTTDVIVNFLAVLEMIKQREIDINTSSGEIVLEKL